MLATTAMKLVLDELERATNQHGSFASTHEGYAVLLEEVDELWDEVKAGAGTTHRGVSEAVQVAAMAFKYLVSLCPEESATAHVDKVERYVRPVDSYSGGVGGGYSG